MLIWSTESWETQLLKVKVTNPHTAIPKPAHERHQELDDRSLSETRHVKLCHERLTCVFNKQREKEQMSRFCTAVVCRWISCTTTKKLLNLFFFLLLVVHTWCEVEVIGATDAVFCAIINCPHTHNWLTLPNSQNALNGVRLTDMRWAMPFIVSYYRSWPCSTSRGT